MYIIMCVTVQTKTTSVRPHVKLHNQNFNINQQKHYLYTILKNYKLKIGLLQLLRSTTSGTTDNQKPVVASYKILTMLDLWQ